MTVEEALQKMLDGYLITNESWQEGEHVYMDNEKVYDENDEEVAFNKEVSPQDGYELFYVEDGESDGLTMALDEAFEIMGEPPNGGGRSVAPETARQIHQLRKLGYTQKQIHAKFGISAATVQKITHGKAPYEWLLAE